MAHSISFYSALFGYEQTLGNVEMFFPHFLFLLPAFMEMCMNFFVGKGARTPPSLHEFPLEIWALLRSNWKYNRFRYICMSASYNLTLLRVHKSAFENDRIQQRNMMSMHKKHIILLLIDS